MIFYQKNGKIFHSYVFCLSCALQLSIWIYSLFIKKNPFREGGTKICELCVTWMKKLWPERGTTNDNIRDGIYFYTNESIDDFIVYYDSFTYIFGPLPKVLHGKTSDEIYNEMLDFRLSQPFTYGDMKQHFHQKDRDNWEVEHMFEYGLYVDEAWPSYKDMISLYLELQKIKRLTGLRSIADTIIHENDLPKDLSVEIMKHFPIDHQFFSKINEMVKHWINATEENDLDDDDFVANYPSITMEDFQLISV